MINTTLRSRRSLTLVALLFSWTLIAQAEETILQYFGTSWKGIEKRIPEVAEAGYTSLWLPPPFKGASGTFSVGFDPFDRFDLGNIDQSGTIPTKYGTKEDLLSLIKIAHRFGIKVYFDNVMAHNGGPLGNTEPGNIFPDIPGFVPEDFHLVRTSSGGWRKASNDVNYQDEWQVLHRNPFAWDIAHETPNTSFDPDGEIENSDYVKWIGVRHPGHPEWYLDRDLPIAKDYDRNDLYTFANKEAFEDTGYGVKNTGANNGRFDFDDLNRDGQHNINEPSEPFSDTGIDGSNPTRRTAAWGFEDGIYNMGDPVPEDVNSMLLRALRWFVDEAHPDGFRLDAVKHVPDYFFGEQNADNKDRSGAGYTGQAQVQFNLTRGHIDWGNHRDSVFTNTLARDDLLLFGEHLGEPPGFDGYLAAGMRIANEDFLNTIGGFNGIGGNLTNFDQPNYGTFGTTTQNASFPLSHDNNSMSGLDRPAAFQYLLTREGLPIVYTDGYNEEGAPSYFPKPAQIPFLGQYGQSWVKGPLAVRRDFVRGTQIPKWGDQNFAAWEMRDKRENESMTDADGTVLVVLMARDFTNGQARDFTTTFPRGARLRNYSNHGDSFHVTVDEQGKLRDDSGNVPIVPSGGLFAFSWDNPRLPRVWQGSEIKPIQIYQDGAPAPLMEHERKDGRDGDREYDYTTLIPRITEGTKIRFEARADGSATNILMKLDGGIDLNSQLGISSKDLAKRDHPPPLDRFGGDPAQDLFTGYEQMLFKDRTAEKFAATNVARNIIGSQGAETWKITIGNAPTRNNGSGPNTNSGAVTWTYHDPRATDNSGTPQYLLTPNNFVELRVKVAYDNEPDAAWVYYTTDGLSFPEGSLGEGRDNTHVAPLTFYQNGNRDGNRTPQWWKADLPSLRNGTVLRYKIGFHSRDAGPRFPFSANDIEIKRRMETKFEIKNFDATKAKFFLHNDHGEMATGLEEGFHILRTKAFLDRNGRSSIFRTETQTFYYDTARPTGQIRFPAEGDQLGGSTYGAVILTDESVTEVQFLIIDSNPDNDQGWGKAEEIRVPSQIRNTRFTKEWRFDYRGIPITGTAEFKVRLREVSSSNDNSLDDETGHYTTILRNVQTGSPVNFRFGFPQNEGDFVNEGYIAKVLFDKSMGQGVTDQDLLKQFHLLINDVALPARALKIVRNETPEDDALAVSLPNLYNGDQNKLHEIRAIHQRGDITLTSIRNVRANVAALPDADDDGMPDIWELQHTLEAGNATGDHGATGDFDDDGISNLLEFLAKKNPLLASSPILKAERKGQNTLLTFDAFPDRRYRLWRSDKLETMTPDPAYLTFEEESLNHLITEPNNGVRQFYALEITMPE